MTSKTRIAAPTEPPYDDLLAVIDRMTVLEVVRFRMRLLARFLGKT